MDIEKERNDFVEWHTEKYWKPLFDDELGEFIPTTVQIRWKAYQAGQKSKNRVEDYIPKETEALKEAAIAWEVCASLHRQYCKGKDPLFKTRQADFVKHASESRKRLSCVDEMKQPCKEADVAPTKDQILIAFGKYISGYRPGEEGWTEEDQQVFEQAMSND